MLKFLKNWTLPIAMLVGAVGYPIFIYFSFLTPYLIFTMLLLTFCKVSPHDLKPKPCYCGAYSLPFDRGKSGCKFLGSILGYFE